MAASRRNEGEPQMSTPLEYHFDHLHIFSSDVPATERWLIEGIGAELVGRHDSRGVQTTTLRLGGIQILIRGAREGEQLTRAGAPHFGTNHFGLKVADIDATVATLRGRGVMIEVEPWDFSPAIRIAFVKGPDEVRIELVQAR
jgi:catechol 2,3-dioxygenase-like lactoylglutathione lyase family enzyme